MQHLHTYIYIYIHKYINIYGLRTLTKGPSPIGLRGNLGWSTLKIVRNLLENLEPKWDLSWPRLSQQIGLPNSFQILVLPLSECVGFFSKTRFIYLFFRIFPDIYQPHPFAPNTPKTAPHLKTHVFR